MVGKTTFAYDDAARVISIHHKEPDDDTIDNIEYDYDDADRVTQETSTNGPTRDYTYDVTNQLTGDGTNSYSFDLAGNRIMSGYSTGTGNRLETDGTWDYTWDDEGNLTQKEHVSSGELWLYTYDHNNRLTKAEHKDSATDPVDFRMDFVYDVFGNRIQRSLDADGDGSGTATVTKFAVDPDRNAWGDLNSSGTLITRRFYHDAIDAVFARMDATSGSEDWYLTDRLGTVRDILNASGSLINNIDYDSFGGVVDETSPSNGDRYKFTARELEEELGLYYYRGRWYQFDIGLFTSEDPIGFGAGDQNIRRYVGNNPVNAADPTGLDGFLSPVISGLGGGIGGGAAAACRPGTNPPAIRPCRRCGCSRTAAIPRRRPC